MASKGGSATPRMSSRLDGDGEPAPAATPGLAPTETGRPCTILLVDDDALICATAASMLSDLGHQVIEAASGKKALEILRAGTAVDLVMTDQAMPGMTGLQLAAEIRAAWPELPVMLVTGYAELPGEAILELTRLEKPYGQDELAAAVTNLVRARP
jgi:CheY-like chemotaxis protein